MPRFALLFAALLASVSPLQSQDWTQLRGPSHSGAIAFPDLRGSDGLHFRPLWKIPLGFGYSSVVVSGDRIFTAAAIGDSDYLLAFRAIDGEEIFRVRTGDRFPGGDGSSDGPMSTPAVDKGVVYFLEPAGQLYAVSAVDGSQIWMRSLPEELGAPRPSYGFSTSPLVVDDLVVVVTGGAEGQAITAFHAGTGEVAWRQGSGRIEAQMPILGEVLGRRQILAPTASHLYGLDPRSGAVIWEHLQEGNYPYSQVTLVEGDHLLVTHDQGAVYYRFQEQVEKTRLERQWATRVFRANGLNPRTPIYHRGHFYAHTDRFLSCVSAETGELIWRSRPPGGFSLVMVEDSLVLVGNDGELVAAAAAPSGYRERGRLDLFDQHTVFTPPSFTDGRFYLRDLHELAAVEVTRGAALLPTDEDQGHSGRFAAFLSALEQSEDKAGTWQQFVAETGTFPLYEEGWLHFVFEGDVPDLAISGDMTGRVETAMHRVAGTPFFHGSFRVGDLPRVEYHFRVFEEPRLDPLNRHRIRTPEGELSLWQTENWREPEFLRSPEGPRQGTLETVEVASQTPNRSYPLTVYRPPGVASTDLPAAGYPLVLLALGAQAREYGLWVDALENLYRSRELSPMLFAFLELPEAAWWDPSIPRLQQILTQDYLPYLESHYPVTREASRRAIIAQGGSTRNMLFLASTVSGLASRGALQSPQMSMDFQMHFWPQIEETELLERVWIDWGRSDRIDLAFMENVRRDAPELAGRLREQGILVTTRELPAGWGWSGWRTQIRDILQDLFRGQTP